MIILKHSAVKLVNPETLQKAETDLADLKNKISDQSKKNFLLENELRYLDSRIALLVKNRLAWSEIRGHLKSQDNSSQNSSFLDEMKFQTEPQYLSRLLQNISLSEMDTLMQTVMFTLFGNQYERREELLLLSVFQMVLSSQFESASKEMNSLLRDNTPASRMMTTYTRRGPGQSFLKNVLSIALDDILKDSVLNLEIDPIKIKEESGQVYGQSDAEDALSQSVNQEVQDIIKARVALIEEKAEIVLNKIYDSLELVPYGIRWICRQIKLLALKHFPETDADQISSLVSGFFMLRFINPAIVSPQAYFLVDYQPTKNSRRTLTLVAKLMQFLANKPSHVKENYMKNFDGFIQKHRAMYVEFLGKLCDVEDFYTDLEMDRYLALQKTDMSVTITENEIYNTHSLLEKYLNVLSINPEDRLREMLKILGNAPSQVPRELNNTITLPLRSKWEDLAPSNLYEKNLTIIETRAKMVAAIHKFFYNQNGSDSTGSNVEELQLKSLEDILTLVQDESLKTILSNNIKFLVSLSEFDAKQFLEHVVKEWNRIESVFREANMELESLSEVFRVINEHNGFLTRQIEDYRQYLQNVRQKAGAIILEKKPTEVNERTITLTQSTGSISMAPNISVMESSTGEMRTLTARFTHHQLEREGVIVDSNISLSRRLNIYVSIVSPEPGSFLLSIFYRGRKEPLAKLDVTLDDLLERKSRQVKRIDIEYFQLDVKKLLLLLQQVFILQKK